MGPDVGSSASNIHRIVRITQYYEEEAATKVPAEPVLAASHQRVQQGGDRTTLLLSGLDTSVVTSSAMLRALTEPFGHIAELYHPEGQHRLGYGGRAAIAYCCSSSAALARLALHGLVIGKGQVQASLAESVPSATESLRDNGSSDTALGHASSPHRLHSPRLGIDPTFIKGPAFHNTPSQIYAVSDPDGLVGTAARATVDQNSAPGYHASPDLWSDRTSSLGAMIRPLPQDLALREKVSVSRPSQ